MQAHEVTFSKLVEGEKQFQVPLYQRTYSWEQEQLQQLWDDVGELVDDRLEGRKPSAHFLGSVVLAPDGVVAGGIQRWLVVDGQQRLTTLMLACTALRDHYRGRDEAKKADRIHNLLLVNSYQDGNDHYRLLPTQADRAAYTACVHARPQAGGAGNIGTAYRYFLGALAAGEESRGQAWTDEVGTVLINCLSIVSITASEGDNVYRIFESINNTGVGLSQSDLLRNYLFMYLPTRGESVYRDLWLPMQKLLGPANLELLVWLDLVVAGDSRAKQSDVYRDQKRRLEPLTRDEAALEAAITTLADRAGRLMRIREPERENDPELREVLERLARWGGQIHYPLALWLLDLVDSGRTTAPEAAEALRYAESYLVRRLLAGLSTTGNNRVFMELPREVDKDTSPAEAVRRFLSRNKTGARTWPGDAAVREAVRTRPFYKTGRGGQRFQVLRRLEESHDASEPVDYAKARLTVEHVLPQTPAQQWFDLLAEETEDGESPGELHERLVHTLGNLTLSGDNARLSNHPFHRKQEILDSSALRMNQHIAAQDRWGRAEILARADELAERAVRLWPGPIEGLVRADEWAGWQELRAALLAMPAGTWTAYGDLAALIGTHANPVGQHIAAHPGLHGAHRVLTSDGRISDGFRWSDEQRTDDPRTLLEAEGIPFDQASRAHRSHRLTAGDLRTLLGRETEDEPAPAGNSTEEGRHRPAERFEDQLSANQRPETVAGVLSALRFWEEQGGRRAYGAASETSCFPMVDVGPAGGTRTLWPLGIYPVSGTVEVVFQYLKRRPPFDDEPLRRELMARMNAVQGIDLAEAKLDLRPSFPLEVFATQSEAIRSVLEWFIHTVALAEARRPIDNEPGTPPRFTS
ncbi:DUF262 domain-containing protein [Streptomyces sp. NPDC059256]|uniref:GmrSD restriction endonuclease domain-containing protein n=1 Tax=Streptomyces sp. NPDC059256 TaxID=3346794 RepID=UPI00367F2E99